MASLPSVLDPARGPDTAAQGAAQAGQDLRALSDLQWQRQMQGLQQATGYTDQLQSLYNNMYSPGGGQMAAGGRGPQAPAMAQGSAMQSLLPKTANTDVAWHDASNTEQQNVLPGLHSLNHNKVMDQLNSFLGGQPTVATNPDGTVAHDANGNITRSAPSNWYTNNVGKPISHAGTKVVNTIKSWL